MSIFSKKNRKWTILSLVVIAIAFFGFRHWRAKKRAALPQGVASGNGRLEAQLVDSSAKEPLRVKAVLVSEGDLVKPGQVVVQLDTITLDSELAEALAGVAAAQEQLAVANAAIAESQSKIELSRIEAARA